MIPDLSVAWVILFVLLLVGSLDALLFRPLMRVMEERQTAVRSARELGDAAAGKAAEAAARYERETAAARTEVYRQMDETRRAALERRAALLAGARQEAEQAIDDAADRLTREAEAARAKLRADAELLAGEVAERVLGRTVL